MRVEINNNSFGDGQFFVIAGPCVIENEALALHAAEVISKVVSKYPFSFVFKSSYDKANRTSVNSYRGMGMEEGLRILEKVKKEVGVLVLSDIHLPDEVKPASNVLDILQIPAFLCRQTDLLVAAGESGVAVNVKKGQFLSPWDMEHVVKKVASTGNKKIFLTERGTTFGYNNLVSDMRSLVIMRKWGYPVVFDGTHSVQLPGGGGSVSSGQREFVAPLVRAAVAAGCDGLFLEVHPDPDHAPSDGPNMINFAQLGQVLDSVLRILDAVSGKKGENNDR
jgi:2-dehydro-3-deoxyphosphooctonate aldolase (KDO 8-P synthase)